MPSPSKNKGNSFERQTADFLTNLYGEKFIRAPGSGAYVGGKNTHRKQMLHEGQVRNFKGDIVPGQSFPRLNVECKSYKEFPFHQLFSGKVKLLDSWIDQCMDVADEGDFSIVFMKFNRKGTFIAIPITNSTATMHLPTHIIYQSENHGAWAFMNHDLFWQINSAEVKKLCQ